MQNKKLKNFNIMRKYVILLLTLALFAAFVTSCNKEGVYNPSKKISKIYEEVDGEKVLSQTWTWDGNKLQMISHGKDGDEYEVFEYNKGQVSKIIEYRAGAERGYTEFTYNKSLLEKMEVYSKGEKTQTVIVEHEKKKISKLIITDYSENYDEGVHKSTDRYKQLKQAMRFVAPIDFNYLPEKTHKSNEDVAIVEFTYEGNNVVAQKTTMDNYSILMTYTYDTYKNPFKDALFGSEEMVLSENNVLSSLFSYTVMDEEMNVKNDFSYVYDKKYPTKVEHKMSVDVYGQKFTETFYTYYEYLK